MKTLIIDNDSEIIDGLKLMIEKFCPQIKELYTADGIETGINAITNHEPNLIFLDVELDNGTGMDLLAKLKTYEFDVVFITAHNKYAVDAFRFSAIDFMLKPIGLEDLLMAVQKATISMHNKDLKLQLSILKESINNVTNVDRKIVLKDSDSIYYLKISDIVMCKAGGGSYTEFYLSSNQKITISKGLKEYEELLESQGFIRTHHSYLINTKKIIRFDKADGGMLVLENSHTVPVSQRKRDHILELLNNM